jgi:hypothetical protein
VVLKQARLSSARLRLCLLATEREQRTHLIIGRGEDLGLVDVVDTNDLEDLGLDEVSNADLDE